MAELSTILETVEFRVVLIDPSLYAVLAVGTNDDYLLPRVRIPRWLRIAQQLRIAIQAKWALHVIVLDIVMEDSGATPYAVAELLISTTNSIFKAIQLTEFPLSELSGQEVTHIELLLNGSTSDAFSHIGWIHRAIQWVEAETGKKLLSRKKIEQLNQGSAFSLVCFRMTGGHNYWLKATGEPNHHEPAVTKLLSKFGKGYVPDVIASRPEWNAVLLSGEATEIGEIPKDPKQAYELFEDAVKSMARLQVTMKEHCVDLLKAGAFNQRLEVLLQRAPELFDYPEEIVHLQPQADNHSPNRARVREIRNSFQKICERSQQLGIPQTIVHGDMNPGNIVIGCGHCQFIDWSEAYVGCCLVALQRLLLLNRVENLSVRDSMNSVLKQKYLEVWRSLPESISFKEGFAYMPLLAAVSELYGRGAWLTTEARNNRHRRSYARVLASHMDAALRLPELREAL